MALALRQLNLIHKKEPQSFQRFLCICCLMQVPSLKRKSSDGPQSSEPVGFKQPVTLTGSNAEQYVQLESALRKQIEV